MKRYLVTAIVGTGKSDDPFRPDVPGGANWVLVAELPGGRALVKTLVPDATTPTASTIADVDAEGIALDPVPLTLLQRTALKTWLAGQGFDITAFDGDLVDNRRKLALFLLRRIIKRPELEGILISGYDVGG